MSNYRITKLDYNFWNSTDAKKSVSFFKKTANSMTQSHDAGGKDPALWRVKPCSLSRVYLWILRFTLA